MNIKCVISTLACTVFFAGAAVAAGQAEREPVREPAVGFGSGTGMGSGGGVGSASSMAGGVSALIQFSGAGSQSFGGGFTGSGPLSSDPSAATGFGPTLTKPN